MSEVSPSFSRQDHWQDYAACSPSTSADFYIDGKGNAEAINRARKICITCPVILECLQHAVEHKERENVWGGLTPSERASYRVGSYTYTDISKESLIKSVKDRITAYKPQKSKSA